MAAIEQALQTSDKIQHGKLGFHSGLTGIAFSAIEIGQKLHQDRLIERGLHILQELNQLSESDYTLDVIDGCAGAIPAIIHLNRNHTDRILNELLGKMGDYLIRQSQKEPTGISWNTMPYGSVASLTGYAHGAAGIALALLELHAYTGEEAYREAALAGFAYEESCFDPEQNNWPDFREGNSMMEKTDESRPCGCAWCHGAPGIGLSHFRAYELTQNEDFKQSGQRAVDPTINLFGQKQLGNFSLCHGVYGNADLLLYASDVNHDNAPADKVTEAAMESIEQFERRKIPFPNGTQSDLNSPDLMLGMAGIGYGFLRLADRSKFPSVLLIH